AVIDKSPIPHLRELTLIATKHEILSERSPGGAGAPAHACLICPSAAHSRAVCSSFPERRKHARCRAFHLTSLNKQSGRPPLAETASHSKPPLSLSPCIQFKECSDLGNDARDRSAEHTSELQ